MTKDIYLGDDWQITLCILYVIGAIVSVWMIVLSPFLMDMMGAKLYKSQRDSKHRNWPKIFICVVLFQPITFLASAVGLWWVGAMAVLPPIHFVISIVCLLAIDFIREETPWEKNYKKIVNKW